MTGRRKGTPCACETDPCSCGSSKGKCIRTINNLSPDPNGDFFIEAGSGITITQTGDNSFEVSFDGTLPSNPLIYKGTVGSGGTVAVLPAADPDNIGWMYIAIEAATSPVTYEVGDTLISDGYTWQVIPSGDDPVDWSQILNTPTTLTGYGITDAMQADTTPGVWAYTHSGIYQGQTAVAGNAAANSLLARDSDGCGQVADPLADTDSDYAVNVRTLNRKLTDGSVSKIGTVNVGSDTKPIKLVGGVPTAVTNDLVDLPNAQAITGKKTVPLEATGTFSDQIASSNKVKNELDNYAPMLRTTGNQSKSGVLTLNNRLQGFSLGYYLNYINNALYGQWVKVLSWINVNQYHNFEFELTGGRNNGSFTKCKFAIVELQTGSKLVVVYNVATAASLKAELKLSYDSATNEYILWAKPNASEIQSVYYCGNTYYGTPQDNNPNFTIEDPSIGYAEPVSSGTFNVFTMTVLS